MQYSANRNMKHSNTCFLCLIIDDSEVFDIHGKKFQWQATGDNVVSNKPCKRIEFD